MRWVVLLPAAFLLAAGCRSYKKAVSTHAVIDDKIEKEEFSFKRSEDSINTSVWQNKRVVVTDIEFYPDEGDSLVVPRVVSDMSDCVETPMSEIYNKALSKPLKRIRHIVIESLKESQASSRVTASEDSLELSKVQINEQKDTKVESRPVASYGWYSFAICAFVGLLVLLGFKKLF